MKVLKKLNPKEIEEIEKLAQEALKYEIFLPGYATFSCTLIDPEGNPVLYYEDKSRSYVRNFYNLVILHNIIAFGRISSFPSVQGYATGKLSFKRIDNSVIHSVTWYRSFVANAGETGRGIVVGSSNQAESIDDFKLISIINHGTGAGRLSYQAMQNPTVSWNSQTKRFSARYTRYFSNQSGGTITVAEVGIYAYFTYASSDETFCIIRDVLSQPINIPNSYDLKVEYTLVGPAYP
jgi:hypothetical protein